MLTAIGIKKLWLNFIQSANVPSQMQQFQPVVIPNVFALGSPSTVDVLGEMSEIDLCPGSPRTLTRGLANGFLVIQNTVEPRPRPVRKYRALRIVCAKR